VPRVQFVKAGEASGKPGAGEYSPKKVSFCVSSEV
jgi:hypothetical protein